jgi:hypothetical protein
MQKTFFLKIPIFGSATSKIDDALNIIMRVRSVLENVWQQRKKNEFLPFSAFKKHP